MSLHGYVVVAHEPDAHFHQGAANRSIFSDLEAQYYELLKRMALSARVWLITS